MNLTISDEIKGSTQDGKAPKCGRLLISCLLITTIVGFLADPRFFWLRELLNLPMLVVHTSRAEIGHRGDYSEQCQISEKIVRERWTLIFWWRLAFYYRFWRWTCFSFSFNEGMTLKLVRSISTTNSSVNVFPISRPQYQLNYLQWYLT